MDTNTKPLQIFKLGSHVAMSGDALSFSESDLAATVAAYDPLKHEAPLVIGHPQHDDPAFGWVKSLSVVGGALEAVPDQVDPAFAELVAKGHYKKISASFYRHDAASNPVPGIYYLRHVGFLGAQPPAVKGLRNAEFADAEADFVEFAELDQPMVVSMLHKLLGFFTGKQTAEYSEAPAKPEPAAQDVPNQSTKQELSVTEEQLKAENARLAKEVADLKASEKQAKQAQVATANAAFADGLVADGRLAPKDKALVVATLNFADSDTPLEFAEGDVKQPLATALKAFFTAQPKVVEFGEAATKDKAAGTSAGESVQYAENADPERVAMDKKIRQVMADRKIDYATAARVVASGRA